MPNNLHVTLNQTTTPWSLDVDQQGNANHVNQSPTKQTITWELTGNAASGSFVALNDPNPGFAWDGTAPSSTIFSDLALCGNGNQMSIDDLNKDASTTGTWSYTLRTTVGNTVYTTTSESIAATTTNPCIKNN